MSHTADAQVSDLELRQSEKYSYRGYRTSDFTSKATPIRANIR